MLILFFKPGQNQKEAKKWKIEYKEMQNFSFDLEKSSKTAKVSSSSDR
jgi:hypothetical protein